ncbi:WecB/TagA/CpsF family glycosyltransferase [Rhizobium sp. L1K21]|uniref:WecB/TagA/CpsF family glycosyltransferase n=1 Tax=Rhizobium sp. L1K21 TaxID=2954933 RepID=UPI002093BB60|nr:WecB/TagA/CpsF family glycosyltransferase [Rhizobium sp. L1K21]MCO6187096.1 WecB/TagA/CpsF family glycosyltransferase [Rhizobium sp. L1K21]
MNHVFYISAATSRRRILGLDICEFSQAEALSFASEMASLPIGQTVISFLNANNANLMMRDEGYKDVLSRQIVFPDGVGVDIASRALHGEYFPANLNGTDFVPALLTFMEQKKRVGLIGAAPGVAERAAKNFARHTPWHEFIAVSDGYFDTEKDSAEIMKRVAELKLDILLVAMGSPKQEKWVDQYVRPQHARLVLSVGALFDFTAGTVERAPEWVRRARLEWCHRLVLEPTRLWRRYILGNPVFLMHVLVAALKNRLFTGYGGGPAHGVS